MLYLRKFWSEQLSSALISHLFTAFIRFLFVMVKSMLLDPLLLWKVDLSLSLFTIWSCLLARYSSSFLPRVLVNVSYQVVDRELVSVATKFHPPLANCISASIFLSCFLFDLQCQSTYLLRRITMFSCIISINTVSPSDICVMRMTSILLFGITMAALFPLSNCKYSVLLLNSHWFVLVFIRFLYKY